MKTERNSYQKIKGFLIIILGVITLHSCQKTPGEAYIPYADRPKVVIPPATPTNTVTFQINDSTYAWTATNYNMQVVTVAAPTNLTHVIVTAKSSVGFINTFDLMLYNNLTVGTVNASGFILTNNQVQFAGGNIPAVVNVTTETLGTTQTVTGTFSGYMYKQNTTKRDSVKVSGSFSVTQ